VCSARGAESVRWLVADGANRAAGTVLEATPMVEGTPGPLVRVHARSGSPYDKPQLDADVPSPWESPEQRVALGARCLKLKLALDPWSERPPGQIPRPDATAYKVRLLGAD
jgi:hypothetical protein